LAVTLESNPISMGSVRSDAGGRYSANVTVPRVAPPGQHDIVVRGSAPDGGARQTTAAVTVQDLDCTDFQYHEDAQLVLDADRSDPHGLDSDHDGDACETLPRRGALARTGTSAAQTAGLGLLALLIGTLLVTFANRFRRLWLPWRG
jgi:hypothetical protein